MLAAKAVPDHKRANALFVQILWNWLMVNAKERQLMRTMVIIQVLPARMKI